MGVIKKFLLVLIPLILLISCKGESFKSDSYVYTNSFSKGPISLDMRVDKTKITTAESIKIVLEGKAADGWKPSFSDLSGDLGKFIIVSIMDTSPHLYDDDSIGIKRTIILKPFLSGEYEIPLLSLDYTDKENNTGVLLSTAVPINVISLLPENTENLQLKEIREPDTFNYWEMFLYISIVVILLIGVLFLVLLIRKGQREKILPGIPPSEEAFDKLTLLLDKKLPQEGMFKEFYFQLNLIVRVYIEKQFAIRAPEQTTEEFLQDLSVSNQIANNYKKVLKDFLVHSDLVKFARHRPSEKELKDSIESCKNFIRVTGEML